MCQTLGQGLAPSEQSRQRSLCPIGEDRQSRQIRHREKYMWYQMKKRAIEKDKARKGERVCGWMGAVVENFKEKVTAEQLTPTHLSGPPWAPGLRERSLFPVPVSPLLPLPLHSSLVQLLCEIVFPARLNFPKPGALSSHLPLYSWHLRLGLACERHFMNIYWVNRWVKIGHYLENVLTSHQLEPIDPNMSYWAASRGCLFSYLLGGKYKWYTDSSAVAPIGKLGKQSIK